jgi:hydrogenase small subunit
MAQAVPGPEKLQEIDVLWITAGLGCDGDTIAMTAATQPCLEDLVQGALPGIPRMKLHNPVLAYEVGDAFMQHFERAAAGQLHPFLLIIEGSIPNEAVKAEGYWAAFGTDKQTG